MHVQTDIKELILLHMQGALTEEEQYDLDEWIAGSDQNRELFERLTDQDSLCERLQVLYTYRRDYQAEQEKLVAQLIGTDSRKPNIRLFNRAATVLLLIVCMGMCLVISPGTLKKSTITQLQKKQNDLAPGTNKAVLTLGDGRTIVLDDAVDGMLDKEGNTTIIKEDGQLKYEAGAIDSGNSPGAKEIVFNTLSTPRSGQFKVVLSDGSKVWLNAASSIRYPVSFTGNERKVEIMGEVYFEVAKDKGKPFKVEVTTLKQGKADVEVFGTAFNVSAYKDESSFRTTLVEGEVKVRIAPWKPAVGAAHNDNQWAELKPGEQGCWPGKSGGSSYISVLSVDTGHVIAWKNGMFCFNNTDIKEVMRQIERWYDVEIVYEGDISKHSIHLTGQVSRNSTLLKMLEILNATTDVHFSIEEKRIIVRK
jgi:ferric-dicitrate binding protein FerR (iron transport regulator)